MSGDRRGLAARVTGFGLVTVAFGVIQPLLLVGVPLALLLLAHGPRGLSSAFIVIIVLGLALTGERDGLWWFERGWPLLLAGVFVWLVAWLPGWTFSSRALAAVAGTVVAVAAVFAIQPVAWLDLDALMTMRSGQAAGSMLAVLGTHADESTRELVRSMATWQARVFPALLAIGSVGALGLATTLRSWLAGGAGPVFGRLRSFRFNDHLLWVLLIGLTLMITPLGGVAGRFGANLVLFMGALYVARGVAVVLSLLEDIRINPIVMVLLIAAAIGPLLALTLASALGLGIADTWLDVRARVRARDADGGNPWG